VVARSLTRFTVLQAPQGPRRVLSSLVRLHMEQASPYARTDGYAVEENGRIALWYWNADAAAEALTRAGADPEAVQFVPESALVTRQGGIRLLALAEGYEARVENERGIAGSIWWREPPTLDEWQAFCRDQGIDAAQQASVPEAQRPQLLDEPTGGNVLRQGEALRRWATERIAYAALAVLLIVPAAYFAGQWAYYAWTAAASQRAIAQLKESAAPIVAARAAAFADSDFIEAIDGVQLYPNPLEVLAGLAGSLGADGPSIAELDFRPGSLRMQFSNLPANFSMAGFVDRVSVLGSLEDVQASLDGMGSMTLTATVRKRRGSKPQ
jgi:hypothetical protein